jgi:integrase
VASIIQINGKWRAQVRRAGHKATMTHPTRREAEAWARKIEAWIDTQEPAHLSDEMTVAELVSEYRRLRVEIGRPVAAVSNTTYMLNHLADDLGGYRVRDLTPQRLAKWAKMRADQGAGGYTVNMELSQLGTAIRHTASFLGIVFPDVVGAARPLLHYAQLIGGGERRTRRPTEHEMAALLAYLDTKAPIVAEVVRVAAITGMRRGELARIQWADVDDGKRAVLVRKRKHPRRVDARDEWVPLLGDAWAIVQRQPKKDARIFPLSAERMTDNVTAATKALGIPNLHLHDMRHEAASKLREMGFDTDERKAVTGHLTDKSHSIYAHVKLEDLHSRFDAAQETPQRPPRQHKGRARQS